MARKKASGGRKLEGWKAKSWFKVYAPEFLGKQLIGEIVS
ncbi:MAG TPA: 30S ribosomal protein S3ae, partial [Methanocorpusculum sp.]|nr:30S ribosomal protein S3ae [Methanocorpusculum sp.]